MKTFSNTLAPPQMISMLAACLMTLAPGQPLPNPQMEPEVKAAFEAWRMNKSTAEIIAALAFVTPEVERTTQILLAACETQGAHELRNQLVKLLFRKGMRENGNEPSRLLLLSRLYILTAEDPQPFGYHSRLIVDDSTIRDRTLDRMRDLLDFHIDVGEVPGEPPLVRLRKLYSRALASGEWPEEYQAVLEEGPRHIDAAEARIRAALAAGKRRPEDWGGMDDEAYLMPKAGVRAAPTPAAPSSPDPSAAPRLFRKWWAWGLGVLATVMIFRMYRNSTK